MQTKNCLSENEKIFLSAGLGKRLLSAIRSLFGYVSLERIDAQFLMRVHHMFIDLPRCHMKGIE
jgi:hypothetical protein